MFRFLKGLMKGGDASPAPGTLPIDELPAWIRGEEEKVRVELAALAGAHRPAISGAMQTMEDVLSGFDAAGREDAPHPKLAGVTERSLPLFLRAMRTSLSRELPGDPEGLYMATGEVLKGCLSAFRGQGRYLASVFPSEMRALRDGADAIGREANAMTPGIARARERLRSLAELRVGVEVYSNTKERAALAEEELDSLGGEVAGSRTALETVRRALAELRTGEEFRACEQEMTRIRELGEERGGLARLYRGTAATAIHLMEKGEKIASRKKDREGARALREAVLLLGEDLPFRDDAEGILGRGQQALVSQAASGDLAPKNREETALLGEPGHLAREMLDLSRRFSALSAEISSAGEKVNARPTLARIRELEREAEDLEKNIARAGERVNLVGAERAGLDEKMLATSRDLQQRVDALSGGSVRISEPGRPDT